jgi:hypothetical protein
MDTKHKHNFILTFFCLAITWISVIHYDNGVYGFHGTYGFFNNFCDSYATPIELVVHPPLSNNFQSGEHLSALTPHHDSISGHFERIPIHGFHLFFPPHYLIDQCSRGQLVDSPIHHIIATLHKQNTWHQSSDGDPLPHHSSLS